MIDIASDKLRTSKWLEANGFAFPAYALAQDQKGVEKLVADEGFPLFAKSLYGRSSVGCFVIHSPTELKKAREKPNYLIQKYIGKLEEEYTAASFVDLAGKHRGTIVMRRLLQGGASSFCNVVKHPAILDTCRDIATKIGARGSINIQLRLHAGQTVCFDINPRFSSTSGIRAQFGFNDVEFAIRHYYLGEKARDLPVISRGTVLRHAEEIYIDRLIE